MLNDMALVRFNEIFTRKHFYLLLRLKFSTPKNRLGFWAKKRKYQSCHMDSVILCQKIVDYKPTILFHIRKLTNVHNFPINRDDGSHIKLRKWVENLWQSYFIKVKVKIEVERRRKWSSNLSIYFNIYVHTLQFYA